MELIWNYINFFRHPINSHLHLASRRFGPRAEWLKEGQTFPNDIFLNEFMVVSWAIVLFNLLIKSLIFYFFLDSQKAYLHFIISKTFLFFLLQAALFPFLSWIYYAFWNEFLSLCQKFYPQGNWEQEARSQVIVGTFSTYTFLALPLVGEVLQKLAQYYYLYLGLRYNLGVERGASMIILLSSFLVVQGLVLLCILTLLSLFLAI